MHPYIRPLSHGTAGRLFIFLPTASSRGGAAALFYGPIFRLYPGWHHRVSGPRGLSIGLIMLDPRTDLGRVLDAKRHLARAPCPLAGSRIFRSGVEPARSALFWPNGIVLDWSSAVQYLSGLLHRSVPPTPEGSAVSL